MAEKVVKEEEKTRDVSKVLEQTTATLQEVERQLQTMRNDLSLVLGRFPAPGFYGATPFGLLGQESFSPPVGPMSGSLPGILSLPGYGTPSMAALGGEVSTLGVRAGSGAGWAGGAFPSLSAALPMDAATSARDLRSISPVSRVPSIDFIDADPEYWLRVDLPGVRKDELDILCTGRTVTIKATAKLDVEEGSVLVNERGPVSYRRTIPLPTEVNPNQCKANLKDGILTLRLTKKVPGEAPRHIDVMYG